MDTREEQRSAWLGSILAGRPARIEPASGDASFRRYFRVHLDGESRILMDAPPPQEDCRAFVQVTGLLADAGVNVPGIFVLIRYTRGKNGMSDQSYHQLTSLSK